MDDDLHQICTFCCEVQGGSESNLFYDLDLAAARDDYIIGETDHFVVMPCIGALTDWYLLIVAKRHTLSVGWLNDAECAELRTLLPKVTDRIREVSGLDSIIFEHGSYDFRDKGGACYDHTHIHVVATDRDPAAFLDQIPAPVSMQPCQDWIEAACDLVTNQQRSYLAIGTPGHDWIGTAARAPSQFFRRCLASWMGEDGEWDWLTFPQVERVRRMSAALTATPEALRSQMADQLREEHYIRSSRINQALRDVPRHLFVPEALVEDAYANNSVTTLRDADGTILSCASAPSVVAMMLEQLAVEPGHRVLETGTGTGYNAALIREIVGAQGQVTTIDIDPEVVEGARKGLTTAGYSDVHVFCVDGSLGDETRAPYDRIVVTVGAWDLPPAWWEQLTVDGRIVVPLRFRGTTRSIAFDQQPDRMTSRSVQLCGFIPMRGHADGERALSLDGAILSYDEDQPIDPEILHDVLDQPRSEAWSGVTVGGQESFDGVWLRMSTAESGTCRISATPSAVKSGRAAPAILNLSPALAEGASLAYFTYRRLPRSGDVPARAELGAIGHGPAGQELAERICEQIRIWNQGRDVTPAVEAFPTGTPDDRLPQGASSTNGARGWSFPGDRSPAVVHVDKKGPTYPGKSG